MYYVIRFEANNDWASEIIITRSKTKAGKYIIEDHNEREITIEEYDTKAKLEIDHPSWPVDEWVMVS